MDCSPAALIEAARVYKCIPPGQQKEVEGMLWCRALELLLSPESALAAPTAVAGAFEYAALRFQAHWTAVAGATGYIIESTDDQTFATYDTTTVGNVTAANIVSRDTYQSYYRVKATNGVQTSAASNILTVQILKWAPATEMLDWQDSGGPQTTDLAGFRAAADYATVFFVGGIVAITDISFGSFQQQISFDFGGGAPNVAHVLASGCTKLGKVDVSFAQLDSISVDDILITCDLSGLLGLSCLLQGGISSPPDPSGLIAAASLGVKGWTVHTN